MGFVTISTTLFTARAGHLNIPILYISVYISAYNPVKTNHVHSSRTKTSMHYYSDTPNSAQMKPFSTVNQSLLLIQDLVHQKNLKIHIVRTIQITLFIIHFRTIMEHWS